MKKIYDVLIFGGGAAGIMCAAKLKFDNFLILEGSERALKKMEVSGGGRCNFTNRNISASNYTGDNSFVESVLDGFWYEDMLSLVNQMGVAYEIRKDSQLFCKHSSSELIWPLLSKIERNKILLNVKIESVEANEGLFLVSTTKGEFVSKKVVVATGGISYPQIGASGVGYEIAKLFGHTVITPKPALVGMTVQPNEFWFKRLSGVSVEAMVYVGKKSFLANVLFAHKGISGPAILNASLYWEKGNIILDFLPKKEISDLLIGKKQISTALGIPKSFAKELLSAVGVRDVSVELLSDEERQKLEKIKKYEFAPAGTFGFSKAEITKGGVCTAEVSPVDMQSNLQKNLYFIGEVLDINGELGGYNFHFAFASAIKCAASLNG